MNKNALILIDLQNDFMPKGALAVKNGDEVVSVANDLMKNFDLVIATKDWHPYNHKSFASNHKDKKPGDIIELNGIKQILWPVHCLEITTGAEFHPELNIQKITKVFYKGTDPEIDSYSAFYDNGHLKSTGLSEYLKDNDINKLFIMGLATDYCVKFSVLDALSEGFEVNVIKNGCRAVNLNNSDEINSYKEMKSKGAIII